MKKSFPIQGGYTLIELVVYLAIFIGISVVIIHSLVTVMRTYARAQTYRQLQSSGDLVMERVSREARGAYAFGTGSVFDTNPGTLSINATDTSGTAHALSFTVSSGALQVTDNGVTGNLSTSEVTVSAFFVRKITTPVGNGVKIELTLTSKNNAATAKFYDTIMFRNQ